MKFAFNKQCVLEIVTCTRGVNDGDLPHFHLKFSCDAIPAEAAAFALGGRSDGEAQQSFFAKDGKSKDSQTYEPRYKYLDSMRTPRDFEGQHMVTVEDLEPLRAVKVQKIVLTPNQSGKDFSATFSITVEDPAPDDLSALFHMMHKSVSVDLVHDRKDLADKADEKAQNGKAAPVVKHEGDAAQPGAVH